MTHWMRLALAACLLPAAMACGGEDTPTSTECPEAKKCASACCAETQECVDGKCVAPDTCGVTQTACGGVCCDSATQICQGGACQPKPSICDPACEGTTPSCVDSVCVCDPDPNSCGADVCVAGACCTAAQACGSTCCAEGKGCGLGNRCEIPGDSCATAIELLDHTPVSGPVAGATDMGGTLPAFCTAKIFSADGADVVYRYVASTSENFAVRLTSDAAPRLWYMTTCGDQSSCVNGSTTPLTTIKNVVAGTVYYLVVDFAHADETGSYTIEVVRPCDPLAAGSCGAGKGCYWNQDMYDCATAGTGAVLSRCTKGNDCASGLDCGPEGLCLKACQIGDHERCMVCDAFGDIESEYDEDMDKIGLCSECPIDCWGTTPTTPICKYGTCICKDSSCGEGSVCYRNKCLAACDPLAETPCQAGEGCFYNMSAGVCECKQAGTVANGGACDPSRPCMAGSDCSLLASCWSVCDASSAQTVTCSGTDVCDVYAYNQSVGACLPCPLGKECGGVCCTVDEFCNGETVCEEAPEPLPNDTCGGGPIELTLGEPVTGDTTRAAADLRKPGITPSTACGGPSSGIGGNDLVYSHTPTADGTFVVRLTPDIRIDVLLWAMEGSCGAANSCTAFSDDPNLGAQETLSIAGVANTTYYFVVDSMYDAGSFVIRVD